MRKITLVMVLMLCFSIFSHAVVLVEKTETNPEFTLSGHVWLRHTLNYSGDKLILNQMSIARNYIVMRLATDDYISNITLDIVNSLDAQKNGDFQLWVKFGYIELTKIPLLADAGISLRAGIQLMYTGTNPIWKYNLYEAPVEGWAGLSSADMGLALIGSLFDKKINYELAMYSGDGYKDLDTDKLKALCANVKFSVVEGLNLIMTYYNKAGINSLKDDPNKNIVSEVVLTYSAGMLVDSYVAVIEKVGQASADKSGVMQILSVYAGIKPFDLFSIHARVDIENTDTAVEGDDIKRYYAGVLVPVAKKVVLMLDYSLKQKQGLVNDNLFITQVKWDW